MKAEEINVTKVKKNLLKIPKTKLAELNDFIEFILMKTESGQSRRIEKLEGIWKGLGFERIPDLERSIRDLRHESENLMLDRFKDCNT